MTTTKIKEKINNWKYVIAGTVALLIFFSVRSCVEKQQAVASAMVKVAQEKVDQALDGTAVAERDRARLKDSIRLEDIKKRAQLKEYSDKQIASEEKVKLLEMQANKAKAEIKNMNLIQVANSLNYIYGGKNAVATSNSVDTRGSLPYQLLETAVEADSAQNIIKEKNTQLVNKDNIIFVKDQQLKASDLNLFSAEKSLNSYKELSQLQTELTKSLEKENIKIKRRNFINKLLIPIAGAAGVYVGVKTSGK